MLLTSRLSVGLFSWDVVQPALTGATAVRSTVVQCQPGRRRDLSTNKPTNVPTGRLLRDAIDAVLIHHFTHPCIHIDDVDDDSGQLTRYASSFADHAAVGTDPDRGQCVHSAPVPATAKLDPPVRRPWFK